MIGFIAIYSREYTCRRIAAIIDIEVVGTTTAEVEGVVEGLTVDTEQTAIALMVVAGHTTIDVK